MRTGLVVASLTIVLAGCGGMTERDSVIFMGAGAGAGAGALIGTAATGNPLVGAVVGGAVGGTIAYFIRPEGCFYRNREGEFWQVPCEDKLVGRPACYIGNEMMGYEQVDCRRRVALQLETK